MWISELESANKNLNTELASLREKFKDLEKSRNEEKSRVDTLDIEIKNLRRSNEEVIADNEVLKAEVQKSVEEIAGALGDGYNRCLGRVSGVGFDATGHSFEDYIHDFAKAQASMVPNQEKGDD